MLQIENDAEELWSFSSLRKIFRLMLQPQNDAEELWSFSSLRKIFRLMLQPQNDAEELWSFSSLRKTFICNMSKSLFHTCQEVVRKRGAASSG